MKLAIMQPYFMPYIGYFQAIAAVDKYILYDKVSFIKKGWINRNRILVQHKGPEYISIPLKNKSSFVNIEDIIIDNTIDWRKKILNLVFYNYKRAKSFNEFYPILENIINFKTDSLSDYNFYTITQIAKYLGIKTKIEQSDDKQYSCLEERLKEVDNSEQRQIHRIVSICQFNNARDYINAIGGQELYDRELLLQNDIQIKFLKTNPIIYKQFQEPFEPNLSIIDVAMHNDIEQIRELLKDYSLI